MGMLELCFTPQFAFMHLLSAHWLPFVNALTQCSWLHLLSAPLLVSVPLTLYGCIFVDSNLVGLHLYSAFV